MDEENQLDLWSFYWGFVAGSVAVLLLTWMML